MGVAYGIFSVVHSCHTYDLAHVSVYENFHGRSVMCSLRVCRINILLD